MDDKPALPSPTVSTAGPTNGSERSNTQSSKASGGASLAPPPPAPDETHRLLDEILAFINGHLYLTTDEARGMALWILQTHATQAFHHRPRLVFSSPVRGCGKTTALKIAELLSHNALLTSSISPAALFRIIEIRKPTLLIDEADSFLIGNEDLRGVINAGFERNGAVIRCSGETYEPKSFACSSPMAIAAIGHLPSTIVDRSIVINMERKPLHHKVQGLILHRPELYEPLRQRCTEWADAHIDALRDFEPEMPSLASDRAVDCWRPLVAIADMARGYWPSRARKAAKALTNARSQAMSEDPGLLVLADIRKIFNEGGADRLASIAICQQLAAMEDRPWPDFHHGRPITPAQLARLLSPFSIRPTTIRLGASGTPKGYLLDDFRRPWEQYLGQ